ncbi:MAG: hypothetical protein H6622_10595 [Halobacteriovoraceae bacterium]|nr:hypothetical protein [Halobacteriovoraceae bacterium]
MLLSKFNFILIAFIISLTTYSMDEKQCLDTNFKTEVSHKTGLFGLLQRNISVNKRGCVIELKHQSYHFIKRRWIVDVCRAPVHIKYGETGLDVFKWENCNNSKSSFCESFSELVSIVQDDGLIFAEGYKEDLDSSHGKFFCAYQLMLKYLRDKEVLTRGQDYKAVLETSETSSNEKTDQQEQTPQAPVPNVEF